jgi:hypothetical protein
LAGVVILAYTNLLFVTVGREKYTLRRLAMILAFTFIVGLFWEFITPIYRKGSTTDYVDILAYMVGGATYWMIMHVIEHEQANGSN